MKESLKKFFRIFIKLRRMFSLEEFELGEPKEENESDEKDIKITEITEKSDIHDEIDVIKELKNLEEEKKKKIDFEKQSIVKRLYVLEQQISVFEKAFPKESKKFLEKIEKLRKEYNVSLEKSKKDLTFEIDPEADGFKLGEVIKIEKEVERFVNKEVKFNSISNRIQKLIVKLNILYNVTLVQNKTHEKEKAALQLVNAKNKLKEITEGLEGYELILNDKRLKDRLIDLVAYAEYLITKTSIRNTEQLPRTIIQDLLKLNTFSNFDYVDEFFIFITQEITNLHNYAVKLDKETESIIEREEEKILEIILCYDKEKNLFNMNFWNDFLEYETDVIIMSEKIKGQREKVKLLETMAISIKEEDVLENPLEKTRFTLTKILNQTQDDTILLMLKFLEKVPKEEITFKEIYFLLLTFDVLHFIDKLPNELNKEIKKYKEKYPYTREEIASKREAVYNSTESKEYIVAITLKDNEKVIKPNLIKALKQLNLDFVEQENEILLNNYYFKQLNSLKNM